MLMFCLILFLTEEEGNKVVSALNSSGPGDRALFVRCDITKQDDVQVIYDNHSM